MWSENVAALVRGVAHLVFPNACLICDATEHDVLGFRHGLCSACHETVFADPSPVCPHCAATVGPYTDVTAGCTACRSRSFGFSRTLRLGIYAGRLKDGILRTKAAPGEGLAEMLGRALADKHAAALRAVGVEVIIPIPLHWRRRWARGYNQAEALARELGAAMDTEVRPGWLQRVKPAPQHLQPSASAREANIRGAFRCGRRASPAGRRILLVDDVMTTGTTVGEAARVLRQAGASEVLVAVLARA